MFYKWICDTQDFHRARAVDDFGDDLTYAIEADYQPFVVPPGSSWADVRNTAVNVGSKLADALHRLQQVNPDLGHTRPRAGP